MAINDERFGPLLLSGTATNRFQIRKDLRRDLKCRSFEILAKMPD